MATEADTTQFIHSKQKKEGDGQDLSSEPLTLEFKGLPQEEMQKAEHRLKNPLEIFNLGEGETVQVPTNINVDPAEAVPDGDVGTIEDEGFIRGSSVSSVACNEISSVYTKYEYIEQEIDRIEPEEKSDDQIKTSYQDGEDEKSTESIISLGKEMDVEVNKQKNETKEEDAKDNLSVPLVTDLIQETSAREVAQDEEGMLEDEVPGKTTAAFQKREPIESVEEIFNEEKNKAIYHIDDMEKESSEENNLSQDGLKKKTEGIEDGTAEISVNDLYYTHPSVNEVGEKQDQDSRSEPQVQEQRSKNEDQDLASSREEENAKGSKKDEEMLKQEVEEMIEKKCATREIFEAGVGEETKNETTVGNNRVQGSNDEVLQANEESKETTMSTKNETDDYNECIESPGEKTIPENPQELEIREEDSKTAQPKVEAENQSVEKIENANLLSSSTVADRNGEDNLNEKEMGIMDSEIGAKNSGSKLMELNFDTACPPEETREEILKDGDDNNTQCDTRTSREIQFEESTNNLVELSSVPHVDEEIPIAPVTKETDLREVNREENVQSESFTIVSDKCEFNDVNDIPKNIEANDLSQNEKIQTQTAENDGAAEVGEEIVLEAQSQNHDPSPKLNDEREISTSGTLQDHMSKQREPQTKEEHKETTILTEKETDNDKECIEPTEEKTIPKTLQQAERREDNKSAQANEEAENQSTNEIENENLPSSTVADRNSEDNLNEKEMGIMESEEESKNSGSEIMEQIVDTTCPTEETKVDTLKDGEDKDTQCASGKSKEIPYKETTSNLVENSLVSHVHEEETEDELLHKTETAVTLESLETGSSEVNSEHKMQPESFATVSDKFESYGVNVIANNIKGTDMSENKKIQIQTTNNDGAAEVGEERVSETQSENNVPSQKLNDEREVSTYGLLQDHISEQNVPQENEGCKETTMQTKKEIDLDECIESTEEKTIQETPQEVEAQEGNKSAQPNVEVKIQSQEEIKSRNLPSSTFTDRNNEDNLNEKEMGVMDLEEEVKNSCMGLTETIFDTTCPPEETKAETLKDGEDNDTQCASGTSKEIPYKETTSNLTENSLVSHVHEEETGEELSHKTEISVRRVTEETGSSDVNPEHKMHSESFATVSEKFESYGENVISDNIEATDMSENEKIHIQTTKNDGAAEVGEERVSEAQSEDHVPSPKLNDEREVSTYGMLQDHISEQNVPQENEGCKETTMPTKKEIDLDGCVESTEEKTIQQTPQEVETQEDNKSAQPNVEVKIQSQEEMKRRNLPSSTFIDRNSEDNLNEKEMGAMELEEEGKNSDTELMEPIFDNTCQPEETKAETLKDKEDNDTQSASGTLREIPYKETTKTFVENSLVPHVTEKEIGEELLHKTETPVTLVTEETSSREVNPEHEMQSESFAIVSDKFESYGVNVIANNIEGTGMGENEKIQIQTSEKGGATEVGEERVSEAQSENRVPSPKLNGDREVSTYGMLQDHISEQNVPQENEGCKDTSMATKKEIDLDECVEFIEEKTIQQTPQEVEKQEDNKSAQPNVEIKFQSEVERKSRNLPSSTFVDRNNEDNLIEKETEIIKLEEEGKNSSSELMESIFDTTCPPEETTTETLKDREDNDTQYSSGTSREIPYKETTKTFVESSLIPRVHKEEMGEELLHKTKTPVIIASTLLTMEASDITEENTGKFEASYDNKHSHVTGETISEENRLRAQEKFINPEGRTYMASQDKEGSLNEDFHEDGQKLYTTPSLNTETTIKENMIKTILDKSEIGNEQEAVQESSQQAKVDNNGGQANMETNHQISQENDDTNLPSSTSVEQIAEESFKVEEVDDLELKEEIKNAGTEMMDQSCDTKWTNKDIKDDTLTVSPKATNEDIGDISIIPHESEVPKAEASFADESEAPKGEKFQEYNSEENLKEPHTLTSREINLTTSEATNTTEEIQEKLASCVDTDSPLAAETIEDNQLQTEDESTSTEARTYMASTDTEKDNENEKELIHEEYHALGKKTSIDESEDIVLPESIKGSAIADSCNLGSMEISKDEKLLNTELEKDKAEVQRPVNDGSYEACDRSLEIEKAIIEETHSDRNFKDNLNENIIVEKEVGQVDVGGLIQETEILGRKSTSTINEEVSEATTDGLGMVMPDIQQNDNAERWIEEKTVQECFPEIEEIDVNNSAPASDREDENTEGTMEACYCSPTVVERVIEESLGGEENDVTESKEEIMDSDKELLEHNFDKRCSTKNKIAETQKDKNLESIEAQAQPRAEYTSVIGDQSDKANPLPDEVDFTAKLREEDSVPGEDKNMEIPTVAKEEELKSEEKTYLDVQKETCDTSLICEDEIEVSTSDTSLIHTAEQNLEDSPTLSSGEHNHVTVKANDTADKPQVQVEASSVNIYAPVAADKIEDKLFQKQVEPMDPKDEAHLASIDIENSCPYEEIHGEDQEMYKTRVLSTEQNVTESEEIKPHKNTKATEIISDSDGAKWEKLPVQKSLNDEVEEETKKVVTSAFNEACDTSIEAEITIPEQIKDPDPMPTENPDETNYSENKEAAKSKAAGSDTENQNIVTCSQTMTTDIEESESFMDLDFKSAGQKVIRDDFKEEQREIYEKTGLKFEATNQSKETWVPSETTKNVTLNEEVPREVENAKQSENINRQTIEEQNCETETGIKVSSNENEIKNCEVVEPEPSEQVECTTELEAEDHIIETLRDTKIKEDIQYVKNMTLESSGEKITEQDNQESDTEMPGNVKSTSQSKKESEETQTWIESIKDVTWTEVVPRATDNTKESENIEEEMTKEESCILEHQMTLEMKKDPSPVATDNLEEETVSFENPETAKTLAAEELELGSDASSIANAPEELIKKAPEKSSTNTSSVVAISVDKCEKENVEEAHLCNDKMHIAPVTPVTQNATSEEFPQEENSKRDLDTSLDDKTHEIKTTFPGLQGEEVENEKLQEKFGILSPVTDDGAIMDNESQNQQTIYNVDIKEPVISGTISNSKERDVEDINEKRTALNSTFEDKCCEDQTSEVPETIAEPNHQDVGTIIAGNVLHQTLTSGNITEQVQQQSRAMPSMEENGETKPKSEKTEEGDEKKVEYPVREISEEASKEEDVHSWTSKNEATNIPSHCSTVDGISTLEADDNYEEPTPLKFWNNENALQNIYGEEAEELAETDTKEEKIATAITGPKVEENQSGIANEASEITTNEIKAEMVTEKEFVNETLVEVPDKEPVISNYDEDVQVGIEYPGKRETEEPEANIDATPNVKLSKELESASMNEDDKKHIKGKDGAVEDSCRDKSTGVMTLSEEVNDPEFVMVKHNEGKESAMNGEPFMTDNNAQGEKAPPKVEQEAEENSVGIQETIQAHNVKIDEEYIDSAKWLKDDEKPEHKTLESASGECHITDGANLKERGIYLDDTRTLLPSRDLLNESRVKEEPSDIISDKQIAAEIIIPEEVKCKKYEQEHTNDEEEADLTESERTVELNEAKIHDIVHVDGEVETEDLSDKCDISSHEKDLSMETTQSDITLDHVPDKDVQVISYPNESKEFRTSTGCKEIPEVQQKLNTQTFHNSEDLKSENASAAEPEAKGGECLEETIAGEARTEATEEYSPTESAKNLVSAQITSEVMELPIEEREKASEKLQVDKAETAKIEEVKEDEEEGDEHKKLDSESDAQVMVAAFNDVNEKAAPHKKSHNILSGVGSKVKHSIAKVKKAITGKSSHPKPSSPK